MSNVLAQNMEDIATSAEDRLCLIEDIPGLYISDLVLASSMEDLGAKGITHILSVTKDDELPRGSGALGQWSRFHAKQLLISDDGLEDILGLLEEVYAWVEAAFQPPFDHMSTKEPSAPIENKVLIHAAPGYSCSGALVVGYIMKKLGLSYVAALERARMFQPAITINEGFAKQLRIYEFCKYEMYMPVSDSGTTTSQGMTTRPVRIPKAPYKVWQKERDLLLGQDDQERRRASDIASMAAEFGRQRLVAQAQGDEDLALTGRDSDDGPGISSVLGAGDLKRRKQWQRVEEMEKTWNGKLIRGEVERSEKSGDLLDSMKEVLDSINEDKR